MEFEESSSTQKSKKAKKQPKDEETSKQVPKKESFQKVEDVIKEERGENNDGGWFFRNCLCDMTEPVHVQIISSAIYSI